MGRAKVHMEPINNNKKRKVTFHRRKNCLIKKALELTTLCDVKVSMIIRTDQQEPEIFPPDPHKVNGLIDLYKRQKSMDPGKIRYFSLSDFFNGRKIKIEQELANEKKKNMEAKYPTWFEFLNNSSEVQLREFANGLEGKIDVVKRKIECLKVDSKIKNLDHHVIYPGTLLDVHSSFVTPSINPSPLPMKMPMNYSHPVFDPSHLFTDHNNINNFNTQPTNPNSEIMKLLMKENDDCYDNKNFGLQPKLPTMIPMNYNVPVFADLNSFNMQSENPNLETLKLVTRENDDCYDYENLSVTQTSTFCLPFEIPELPPFMHMNPVSTSESSSQITEYNAGADGNHYHYTI
ncbi:floral homeotic protein DEFICIENS [Lactuca sativa]|uniref:floral homeotic protein DEFICIENS n=1 Tax=Lactuca sativa TaxID=4236 RepID=UPI000CBD8C5E|nr:floral homeotic protein DEFICIENS [Lactuca sativa]